MFILRKLYDPDQTVKHISLRDLKEMKARRERNQQRTEKLFKFILWATLFLTAFLFISGNLVRLAP